MNATTIRLGLLFAAVIHSACAWSPTGRTADHTVGVRSYAGPSRHTMVVISGGEFVMGSPLTEAGRSVAETPHRVRIPRIFAIATTEVTNEQFERFLAAVPDYRLRWRRATTTRWGE